MANYSSVKARQIELATKLEICIDSFESAKAACDGGADRIEICSNLAGGGTTPSFGLVRRCVNELPINAMVMIRPHDGGFVYGKTDVATMVADIQMAKDVGADGVVFGVLDQQRRIDQETCRRLLDVAEGLETTFHRAFDVVKEPIESFDQIQKLGFTSLLTSGQQPTALSGCELIRDLVDQSTTTKVIAGAGVRPENAALIIHKTGVPELHASASLMFKDGQANECLSFSAQRRITQSNIVRAIKSQMVSGDLGRLG